MPPKKKSNKRKLVTVADVHQTEEPLPQADEGDIDDDSVTAGDPADFVPETEAAGAEGEEEAAVTGGGAVPKRVKKVAGRKAKAKSKTPDDGGTVINIARPGDISEEQELKIVAWVEDHEIIYNQGTKDFKNKAKKDRMFAEFGETIGLSGECIFHIFHLYTHFTLLIFVPFCTILWSKCGIFQCVKCVFLCFFVAGI